MWELFLSVFTTVFLAEIGDKTQLASFCFASGNRNCLMTVFLASSAALVSATAIGVFAGALLSKYISVRMLHIAGGCLFIVLGILMLVRENG